MHYFPNCRQRIIALLLTFFAASLFWGLQRTAGQQSTADEKPGQKGAKPASVNAAKRGNPHVSFEDGRDLKLGGNASASHLVALVTADFDSDGIADAITADAAGSLQLLKGVDPSIFAIDPTKKEQPEPEPFSAVATGASLGISPDSLFAGDFNADGKQDILGTAKGSNIVMLLSGDGRGHFSQPTSISVDGGITAIESGEVGKPDGQADLVITYTNKNGSFLAVYEHPESAFKHAPEIINLPSAANTIAIGNTDEDFYSDIAVGCGNDLVIVHERGQAYPWDIVKDSGIKRPSAVVDIRRMPFSISSMAVGRFGEKRGTSLAILGGDGNIYQIESPKTPVSPTTRLSPAMAPKLKAGPFEPADSNGRKLAMISQEPKEAGEIDAYGKPTGGRGAQKNPAAEFDEKTAKNNFEKVDLDEITRKNAEDAPRKAEMQERTKSAFIRGISAKTSSLAEWQIKQITNDNRFISMAAERARLTKAAVSDSPFDDLAVTSSRAGQVEIVSRFLDENGRSTVENTVINGSGGILGILPMRLNLDGLSDLVVLHDGSTVPEVLMTAPSAVFVVNTTDDDGDCNFGNSCSLRDAIRRANLIGGSSTIYFNISSSPSVITPLTPLPSILQPVTIQGAHMGNGTKLVEISGINAGAPADGLKIRTSNAVIYDLAITGFKSQTINGSQVGGNGIAIESDSARPNNVSNLVLECFLGIDPTGTFAKPNMAAGILIFDSDNNSVGNSTLSGNNTGIAIEGGNTNNFTGNIMGLNAAGTGKVPNFRGMFLAGANNFVGGDIAGSPNTISGNGVVSNIAPCVGYGIYVAVLADLTTLELITHDNNIAGNKIGTDQTGGVGLGNCWQGINTNPVTATTIGSITESGRNLISGNGWGGVFCEAFYGDAVTEGGFCSIMGNNVGTDITGNISIANDARNDLQITSARGAISVASNYSLSAVGAPGGTTPGGACTGFCNLVSGNDADNDIASGIDVGGTGTVGVFNNYVGTKRNGAEALGNGQAGISVFSTNVAAASPVYFVGGYTTLDGSLGNLVAGNSTFNSGIEANSNGGPGDYHILGNLVGTDVSGTTAIPNGFGVQVITYLTNTVEIGDTNPLGRNVIAGNANTGIQIYGIGSKIVNNAIGANSSMSPLGNAGNGIYIGGGSIIVGGVDPTTSNIIANNGKVGVRADGGTNARIRGNVINNNGQLGIDLNLTPYYLESDGVTLNDDCENDSDAGPNGLQNHPMLAAPVINQNGTQTLDGILKSHIRESYVIDLYASSTADPSGHGEGQVYTGSITVATDGNGFGQFNMTTSAAVPAGWVLSATATDSFGSTSEFSAIAGSTSIAGLIESLESPSTCQAAIVVNIDTDEPDANINDGLCDVDVSNTGLQCSLRAAMEEANHRPGYQRIIFAIPGAGIHTIIPQSRLPRIDEAVDIDATTQEPSTPTPSIWLNGTGTATDTAIVVYGVAAYIRGFAITGFSSTGILAGAGGIPFIEGCHIGVAPDGTTVNPNVKMTNGIALDNAPGSMIGGDAPEKMNVIANNIIGIEIINTSGARLWNNRIGTNRAGTAPLGNSIGVRVGSSQLTEIGKNFDTVPNLISGNSIVGIDIGSNSSLSKVVGNLIGTNLSGNASLGNGLDGVYLHGGATENRIGSGLLPLATGNVISGHAADTNSCGILIGADAGINNRIGGNVIGLSKNKDNIIPNYIGLFVNADSQIIGGAAGDVPNVIAGNGDGVVIQTSAGSTNPAVNSTTVNNNYIGTTGTNLPAIFNVRFGIRILGNVEGSTVKGNVIGSNLLAGIYLGADQSGVRPFNNKFIDNKIGMNVSTDAPIPNKVGVLVRGGVSNTFDSNTISGNQFAGLVLGGLPLPDFPPDYGVTSSNLIFNNRIGVDRDGNVPFPNGPLGLVIGPGSINNCIGSCNPAIFQGGPGNTISGHVGEAGFGVLLGSLAPPPTAGTEPTGNKFRDNVIGLSRDTNQCIPNTVGIVVAYAGPNIIGETTQASGGGTFRHGNIITCNTKDAIGIQDGNYGQLIVGSNWVGTRPNGGFPIGGTGQFSGIKVFQEFGTESVRIEDNDLGGFDDSAIEIVNTGSGRPRSSNRDQSVTASLEIRGNRIGIQKADDGSYFPIPNDTGIKLNCVSGIYIGDLTGNGALKNVIAGNNGVGVLINGLGDGIRPCSNPGQANTIKDSIIGTDPGGNPNLSNGGDGISIIDSPLNTVSNNQIGGNAGNGIAFYGSSSANAQVIGNRIGVINVGQALSTVTSTRLRPNGQSGILIDNASFIGIGGPFSGWPNVISGNQGPGITIQQGFANHVFNNFIGTDESGSDFGNGGDGIIISQSSTQTWVGDPFRTGANTIAFNDRAGVKIDTTAGGSNLVETNKIFNNAGIGIDLGSRGFTANDPGDADEGGNRSQNYPEIINYGINAGGELIVTYHVDTDPSNATYPLYVEFFIADAAGQGRVFLGYDSYTASDHGGSGGGTKTINLGLASDRGWGTGDLMTSSGTDADYNTSEFFPVVPQHTPTPTASDTPTTTPTDTPTSTATNTPTDSPTDTPTSTATNTPTDTPTPTPTVPPSITGTVTYGNAIGSPSQRFVSNVLLSGAGSIPVSALTNFSSGSYSLSGFGTGAYTITPSKTGGANAAISSFDAAKVAQHVVGPPSPHLSGSQLFVADVSGNGEISSFDAAEIAHYVVSNTPVGASGTWKFSPASSFHSSVNSSIAGEDYSALLFGDVSGNWDDPISLPRGQRAFYDGPEKNVTVTAPRIVTNVNDEITIPVQIDGAGNKGIIAYEFDLRYDPHAIRPLIIPIELNNTISRNMTAITNIRELGLLKVAVYGPIPINENGVIMNLRFMAVGRFGSMSPLVWERILFNEGYPEAITTDGQVELSGLNQNFERDR